MAPEYFNSTTPDNPIHRKVLDLRRQPISLSALLIAILLGGAALTSRPADAQLQTIITDHFRIHFMPGAEGTHMGEYLTMDTRAGNVGGGMMKRQSRWRWPAN